MEKRQPPTLEERSTDWLVDKGQAAEESCAVGQSTSKQFSQPWTLLQHVLIVLGDHVKCSFSPDQRTLRSLDGVADRLIGFSSMGPAQSMHHAKHVKQTCSIRGIMIR